MKCGMGKCELRICAMKIWDLTLRNLKSEIELPRGPRPINRSFRRELYQVPGARGVGLHHRGRRTKTEHCLRLHRCNGNHALDHANPCPDLVCHQGACLDLPSALLRTSRNCS